jgi:hypothetical protein
MWYQLGNIALGIWLIFAPAVLPSTQPGSSVAHIIGPMIIWFAALALRDVTRPFRAFNVASGVALTIVPWLVPNTGALTVACVLTGWAVIVLSLPRGRTPQRTGNGWWGILSPEHVVPPAE